MQKKFSSKAVGLLGFLVGSVGNLVCQGIQSAALFPILMPPHLAHYIE